MNASLAGVLGGSPGAVLVRLLVVSFVAGIILSTMGFEPETLYENGLRLIRHMVEYGLSDVKQVGRVLLTGAMVVVPIWIVLRLVNAPRGK